MIFTCTLNPSVDYVIHVDTFTPGGLNRGNKTFYYPGGKGINVSRVLNRLGRSNTAIGFLGGFTGDFIKNELTKENIDHQFIAVNGTTRVNMKLKSTDETEINGPGPEITAEQQEQLFKQIAEMSEGDYLVAAGSVPSTIATDFYVQAAELCRQNGVKMIADTSSNALKEIVGRELFLVKPNHHELGELFDTAITTHEQAAHYGKQLQQKGARHVIISMGGNGAIYINKDTCLRANVPSGQVKNTVGSGDSMVAGFLSSYVKTKDPVLSFKTAVAAGSATAFSDDLCEQEDVEALLSKITTEAL
ncbi:1-phosphofructokinase [Sediminibacillus albus]|uniref:Tagatose-6-phosphate kinase n=1 Tax=Sediminibacillus albus TaxID=407036 RepID=A0A1G8YSX0_9BACI|nr:1-phosphofructokinase [Sediminibacillus albus]SDK05881.1 1-phosphofructokinase [Sediminibacillus albus]